MVHELIWESRPSGAFPLQLFRYQTQIAGYQAIRFEIKYGLEIKTNLSRLEAIRQIGSYLSHQLESCGLLG